MNIIKKLGIPAGALALGLAFLSPAPAANAATGATTFHLVNQATGKCLQMQWKDEKVIQAKCKNTKKQLWGNYSGKLYTEYNRANWCLASSGREKPVYLRTCDKAQPWTWTSLNNNAKTLIASAKCSYMKVVSGKVMCGYSTGSSSQPGHKKMTWIIKY